MLQTVHCLMSKGIQHSRFSIQKPSILRCSSLVQPSPSVRPSRSKLTDGDDLLSPKLLSMKEELIELRDKTRKEINKPAFLVFTNNAMSDILEILPTTEDEIDSIAPKGRKILRAIYPDILRITGRFKGLDIGESVSSVGSALNEAPPVISTPQRAPGRESVGEAPKLVAYKSAGSPSRYKSTTDILLSELSFEQQQAAERAMTGQNVFITGSAGTGKSYLLKFIVQELKNKYAMEHGDSSEGVFVTAPTGVAAINVGGTTIHSFAGIGLGKISALYPSI